MILFVNVFITDQRMCPFAYNGLSPEKRIHSKLDVFKYALASYSVIPWDEAIFYIKLDEQYQKYQNELEIFIHELFPKNTTLHNYRLDTYEQWINAIQLPNHTAETWIWFTCNDDHPFIDSSLNALERLIELASKLSAGKNQYVSIFPSHWQEMMANKKRSVKLKNKPYQRWNELNVSILDDNQDYYLTTSRNCVSIQIVTKKLLQLWFSDSSQCPKDLRRTDAITAPKEQITMVPYKELARHFDVYSHAFLSHTIVPPLFIPKGFFEKKIRIQYGGNKRLPGYVFIHPEKKMIPQEMNYQDRITDDMCDLNILQDEIPLFWRDRIVHTASYTIAQDAAFKSYIMQKIKEVCADPRFGYTPFEAIQKVTSAFCQKYNPSIDELRIISKAMCGIKEKVFYRWRIFRYSYLITFTFYFFTLARIKYPSAWKCGKKLKDNIRKLWKKPFIQI